MVNFYPCIISTRQQKFFEGSIFIYLFSVTLTLPCNYQSSMEGGGKLRDFTQYRDCVIQCTCMICICIPYFTFMNVCNYTHTVHTCVHTCMHKLILTLFIRSLEVHYEKLLVCYCKPYGENSCTRTYIHTYVCMYV